MKLNASHTGRNRSRSLLLVPLAALSLLTLALTASYAGPVPPGKAAKSAKTTPALPSVTLPYTFVCPDCGLKITIKTAADWKKDCPVCACGKTSLSCYHDIKSSSVKK